MSVALRGEKVTVYVPCDVVLVRTRLGFQETVTPIEQVVLRAVHAGADTLGQLVKTLGLSERLALHLVQDLWRTGYLTLVRSYAGLKVTREVAKMIAENRLDEMKSAEMVIEDRMVMLDKLSGYLLPHRGTSAPAQRRLAVPVENSEWQVADAGPEALVEALERGLALEQETSRDEHTDGTGRPRRVLGAYVADSGRPLGRRWLPLEVRAAHDPDTDQITITVEDDKLPMRYRQEAGRQLTLLVAERPDEEFSRALRGQALPSLFAAPSIESAVARLRQQAEAGEDVPGRRGDRHRELVRLYRQVRDLANDRVGREVDAEIVAGERHSELLAALIAQAREQVVLVNPWLRYRGLVRIETELRQGIERDVQVCVLWGIQYREQDKDDEQRRGEGLLYRIGLVTRAHTLSPSPDVGELIDDAGTEPSVQPGQKPAADWIAYGADPGDRRAWLLATKQSARTHAKVAIFDDKAALVTSWNFLNSPNAKRELGVLVRAQPGSDTTSPLQDLLRWTRSTAPRYDMSRLVKVDSFGTLNRSAIAEEVPESTPPVPGPPARKSRSLIANLPDPPDPPASEGQDDAANGAARAWADAWVETARAAERWLLARVRPAAWLVVDGSHRDVLWRAMREARTRLVITSDRLSGQVVESRLIATLTSALERGVEILILYGRPHENDELEVGSDGLVVDARSDVENRLAELASQFPDRFTLARSGTHAKVVLWDDQAAIGSFNFLSHEGTFTNRSAHRQRSEVSVLLKGQSFCDELANALGLRLSTLSRPVPPPPVVRGLREAQSLLNAVAAGVDPADAIGLHLELAADAWAVLQRLAESTSRMIVRYAAAWCLTHREEEATAGALDRWLRWLIEDLWTDHAYLEAAVLRNALDAPEARPRPHIAELAAARGTAGYCDALMDAWTAPPCEARGQDGGRGSLQDVASAERRAVVAAAIECVLFDGDETALEILIHERALIDDTDQVDNRDVQQAWLTVADAAVQFSRESSGRPLPLKAIRSRLAADDGNRESARMWAELRRMIIQAANTQLANTHSQRTLTELFRTADGPVARLGAIADREDLAGLDAWAHEAPRTEPNWGRLLDDAGQRVNPGRPPMHSTHRRKVIRDLMAIGRHARRLAGLARPAESAADNPDDVALLAAARRFRDACVESLPMIREDASSSAPEQEPVNDIVARLSVLETWRRVELDAAATVSEWNVATALAVEP